MTVPEYAIIKAKKEVLLELKEVILKRIEDLERAEQAYKDAMLAEIQSLPWKPSRYGEWIFSNDPKAKILLEIIKKEGHYIEKGFEYTFSGQDEKFITRNPVK